MSLRRASHPSFFLVGANHKSATIELREALFIPEDQLALVLPEVQRDHQFRELAALSTCNRLEIFGVVDGAVDQRVIDAYLDIHRRTHGSALVTDDIVKQSTYVFQNEEVINHVLKVASSLDSLVLGETQITGQFKDALNLASAARTLGPLLSRLGQEALKTAKKIRTETAIGRHHVSIGHAALDLAAKIYGNLQGRNYLIIGAGEMARVTAQHVLGYKPRELFVANRTPEKAAALVRDLKFGKAFSIDEVGNLIAESDVVISATASASIVVDASTVARAQSHRRGRPLVLLDIALPRDIAREAQDLEDVYLFDIDDLQQVVGANYDERRRAADEAMAFVTQSASGFAKWLAIADVKPALQTFRSYMEWVVRREAERTLGRDLFKSLTEEQRGALEKMLAAIANRPLNDAAFTVTNPPDGIHPLQLAETLEFLFKGKADGNGDD